MLKQHLIPAIRLVICFSLITGLVFPGLMFIIGQALFPEQANGSLISREGRIVGSRLIGQDFRSPRYFHPRPSAAGAGYDSLSSGGTNLGPTSKKLFSGVLDNTDTADGNEEFLGVQDLAERFRRLNSIPPDVRLPVDAVTRSASGLDPHISPTNAALQLARVAKARHIEVSAVENLVARASEPRFLGVFGEPRVNVLALNLMLDKFEVVGPSN